MKGGTGNFGLTAMAGFLLFGATMEAVAGITLLFPSGFLDPIWRLNPAAGEQLRRVGIAFGGLAVAMIAAAIGWMRRRFWGWALAVIIVASQVLGDFANAVGGEWLKGLVGAAVARALLVYLLRPKVRQAFGEMG